MPEELPIPEGKQVDIETEPLKLGSDVVESAYALELVIRTFGQYENFRNQHDLRWNTHDELYTGWVDKKVWEGTNVPRSNIAHQITFDQVESMVPAVSQALFNVGPEWFQVSAEKGTDPKEAQQIQDVLSYYLEHPGDDETPNAKAELELAIKSVGLYGNGGVSIEWDVVADRPRIEAVDIRDIYIDPGCSTPSIDHCKAVIRRRWMSVEEILSMAKDKRMNIPSREQLVWLSRNPTSARADSTKSIQEAIRGINYKPLSSDWAIQPADRGVEVLMYFSKKRIIWVLNRKHVAYNGPNPYNFIPFCFAPCYLFPFRWYAQSIADVQEGNQRYIQGLLNAHLDELALALHPPRYIPQTANITPSQMKWRPGGLYQISNPKDVQVVQPGGATANVFPEIQYLELNAEKRTGLSGLGAGVPRASNANRTASGMQMQLSGSSSRISHIVSNVEQYMIVPLLYKLYKMVQFHKGWGDSLPAANQQDGNYQVDARVFTKKCKFRMNAASRMVTRDKLVQIFPVLAQYLFQGPLMEQLHSLGKTVDFEEAIKMLQDATNVGQIYNLVRPMSDQEKQAASQPPPPVMAQMQQKQQELQTRAQIAQGKNQTDLQIAQIQKQPDPADQYAAQMEMQKMQQEMQNEQQMAQQKMFVEAMMAKIKLQAKQQEHQMDLQKKQADVQLAAQQGHQQMQQSQMQHLMNLQQMKDQAQMQQYTTETTSAAENKAERDRQDIKASGAERMQKIKAAAPARKKAKSTDRPK